MGANASAGFTQFIYNVTAPLMAPFTAVFGEAKINGAVFDWSILLAIAVYALIGWLLTALVRAVTPRESYQEVEAERSVSQDVDRVEAHEPEDSVVTPDDPAGHTRDLP